MLKSASKSLLSKLLLLLVTISWGSSFIFLKNTLSDLGDGRFTLFILSTRFLLSVIVLFIIAVIFGKLKSFNKRTALKGMLLGVVLFLAYAVQTLGLNYTTASKNAFLTAGYVVLTPFLAFFLLKEVPKLHHYFGIVICFIGIMFVSVIGKKEVGTNETLGDILTLCCCVFYALQIILIKKYASDEDAFVLLFFELLTTGVLCGIVSSVAEFPRNYEYFHLSTPTILSLLYLAMFATCFAQFGQMYGEKHVSSTAASLILSLEAVFGVLFELIIAENTLNVWIAIGFVLILIGEIFGQVDFLRKKKEA